MNSTHTYRTLNVSYLAAHTQRFGFVWQKMSRELWFVICELWIGDKHESMGSGAKYGMHKIILYYPIWVISNGRLINVWFAFNRGSLWRRKWKCFSQQIFVLIYTQIVSKWICDADGQRWYECGGYWRTCCRFYGDHSHTTQITDAKSTKYLS